MPRSISFKRLRVDDALVRWGRSNRSQENVLKISDGLTILSSKGLTILVGKKSILALLK